MATAPFTQNPNMTAIAVAYKQGNLIADEVLPRIPVDGEKFSYLLYPQGEGFTVPETFVGRKGKPAEVEFTSTEVTSKTDDHGLDAPVPNSDVLNYESARKMGNKTLIDPRLRATSMLTQLLMTRREKRTADLVLDPANYAAANKVVLSGTSMWSDYVNSDPAYAIAEAMDNMFLRPTLAVFSRKVWSKLSRHPKLRYAVFGDDAKQGQVSRAQFAELFELPNLPLIGEGWLNTAAKGQPTNMVRIWGTSAAFLHRDMNADNQYGTTFGFTAEHGTRVAGTIEDPDMGIRGGQRARVGESVKEVITAPDLGYLFSNAV